MNEPLRIVWPALPEFREVEEEFQQVWSTALVTTGKFTRRFEEAVAEYTEARHAIAVNSCTAGLMLVLRALELTGEVILPSFTFTATALAVMWNGLKPVFADADPQTFTLDPRAAEAAVTPQTAAIMPVNVYGLPPHYGDLLDVATRHKLKIVVDSAHGLGASYFGRRVGGFGDAEVFSLSPTKVVTAVEGGVITTNDAELAHKIRQMRDYGKGPDGEDICWQGLSARFSELHAIVGYHNLRRIEELRAKRLSLVDSYKELLRGFSGISFQSVPDGYGPSGNYFVIRVEENDGRLRDHLYHWLKSEGIEAKRYFYPPVHRQELHLRSGNFVAGDLSVTEKLSATCLALPLHHRMGQREVAQVVESMRRGRLAMSGRPVSAPSAGSTRQSV